MAKGQRLDGRREIGDDIFWRCFSKIIKLGQGLQRQDWIVLLAVDCLGCRNSYRQRQFSIFISA
jgi:hypothetical protein